ncbi:E3 ubiquitin-protein ligase RHF1A [Prunus yedoensis var. nudiflora]|uniref:E3 ubiquitin-protein ligase RHF1A n=1 Tax=Prunus yedoensis var. nudiflora TaxID=2094558 RepID=A0A314UKV8_PRUYE|nr:E3 ubiquitin-protein ligase RHF1A [Prunus yedoensis var. nudiflora]
MKTPAASALSLSTAMTQPLLPAGNRNTIFTYFFSENDIFLIDLDLHLGNKEVKDDSFSDDSYLDERIIQHLAAASSRACYIRTREKQRFSGLGPSHVFVFSPHGNASGMQQTYPTSQEECQSLGYGSPNGDSPTSQRPHAIKPPPSFICSTAVNSDVPYKPRYAPRAKNISPMWIYVPQSSRT